ncbi:periplasmic sensor signal transduction histidine kinase [Enhygromyxa salina]|uniref:histidine kinase n=1 Tax=Enhygromyxa salina TaxID=215803 RepID=A0A0C1ZCD4_9BACT|nr:ATP-binding protein [Enhygromyxa salina]KIG15349.1 periplasmic sensor signal transduction histidine kinase [Enhygromyxa salina]
MHHSLRRRLFGWFGFAILISVGLGYAIHGLVEPSSLALPLALGGGAMVLWIASGGIAWAVTRPLVELVSVARDIGEGKLDRRMRLGRLGRRGRGRGHGGEVAVLAEAVNTMAARIEQQLADQRELLAGVSHELRTPLGHLRVLIDTAREAGEAAPSGMLDELEREVIELDALVDQLLAHSRLEFARVERRPLDPVELAVRALERVGEDASKIEVESEVEQVSGDPTLLGRALANLLTNARAHGRGLVALRVYDGEPGELCFCAEDRGPGFAEGEPERVFASFVQGRERRGGSLGLGLSLVERVAVAHGGRAWAKNLADGGASVGFCVALGDLQ